MRHAGVLVPVQQILWIDSMFGLTVLNLGDVCGAACPDILQDQPVQSSDHRTAACSLLKLNLFILSLMKAAACSQRDCG